MTTRFYPYNITLEAPAIFTRPEGEPNSATSYPFVPGAALRGAVASALAGGANQAGVQSFRTLILSGKVCYLNAYPPAAGRNNFPAPLSFRKEKYQEVYYDLAMFSGEAGEDHRVDEDHWPQHSLERVGKQFLSIGVAGMYGTDSRVNSALHHQRDRVKGRAYREIDNQGDPGETHGALFTYEAIQEGQEFRGSVVVSGRDDNEVESRFQQVQEALARRGNRLLLGRSRRAKYGGQAQLTWVSPAMEREVSEIEGLVDQDLVVGQEFRVQLTSDYLGRNSDTGQVDPAWIEAELKNRLGNRASLLRRRLGFRLAGGYNNTWGLALPQSLALEAGSVLLLQARVNIPYTDLLALEQSGLGERRAEGYGRILFLEALSTSPSLRPTPATYPQLPVSESPTIRDMQNRLLKDAIIQEILQVAASIASSATNLPSSSLLRRLQLPLRAAVTTSQSQEALTSLGRVFQGLRKPARDWLSRCRISLAELNRPNIRLGSWLQDVAGAEEKLDQLLRWEAVAQHHHITSSEEALGQLQQLDPWIRVRLLEEILSALARRRGREESGRNGHEP